MWWEEINSTKEVLEKSFSDIFEAFVAMTRYVQNATNPTPSRQKEFVLEKVIENLMINFTNISEIVSLVISMQMWGVGNVSSGPGWL